MQPELPLSLGIETLSIWSFRNVKYVKVLHSICQEIWKTQQWPQDWKRSVFIPIPKKGNAKQCSNYHIQWIWFPLKQTGNSKSLSSLASEQNVEWSGVLWPSLKCCNGPDSDSCLHKTNSYLSNPSQLRRGLHHRAAFGQLCWLWWWESGNPSKEKTFREF